MVVAPGQLPDPSCRNQRLKRAGRETDLAGREADHAETHANEAASSSRSAVGRKGGKSGSYDDWKVDDLRRRAREIGIEGRSHMKKQELVKALRSH